MKVKEININKALHNNIYKVEDFSIKRSYDKRYLEKVFNTLSTTNNQQPFVSILRTKEDFNCNIGESYRPIAITSGAKELIMINILMYSIFERLMKREDDFDTKLSKLILDNYIYDYDKCQYRLNLPEKYDAFFKKMILSPCHIKESNMYTLSSTKNALIDMKLFFREKIKPLQTDEILQLLKNILANVKFINYQTTIKAQLPLFELMAA